MQRLSARGERRPGIRWQLIVAPLALFAALVSWAVASPVGASPDDDFHLASIWCGLGERPGLCEPGDTPEARTVPKALLTASQCFAYRQDDSAACELPPADEMVSSTRGNFTGTYPPVFYAAMGVFASDNIPASVIWMRIVNAGLFVGLISLLAWLVPAGLRKLALWPVMLTIVPLGMFIVPSTNPSSWAVISAAGVWLGTYAFLGATTTQRRIALAALVLVLTVMGAGSRADAAVYSAFGAVLALVLSWKRVRLSALNLALPAAVVLVSIALFFTASQSGGLGYAEERDSVIVLIAANLVLLPELWVGVFGTVGLGWLDTNLPGTVWVPAFLAFGAIVFAGLRILPARKAVALVGVMAALVVLPLYYYVTEGVFVGTVVQPRYIYPLIIILAGVALYGSTRADLRLTRLQLWLVGAFLVIANAVALHTNLRRYVTGTDVRSANLDANLEWWWDGAPLGPNAVWVLGAIAFTAAVVALAWAARAESRTGREIANA
jgi:hypothetical protein